MSYIFLRRLCINLERNKSTKLYESFQFRENRSSEKQALFKGMNFFPIRTSRIQYPNAARLVKSATGKA